MARWRRWNRQWELVPSSSRLPRQVATQCRSGNFSEQVESGSVRFPCLMTPSPTPQIRPPPSKRKRDESPESLSERTTNSSLLGSARRTPSWKRNSKGKLGPPASSVQEFLHDFPEGYTKSTPERSVCCSSISPGTLVMRQTDGRRYGHSFQIRTMAYTTRIISVLWNS